ncbi:hypothetical protein brsh051_11280 [Brooklawnia propionicigenes]|uniref:Serine/arginine repetitive matrix protein 2 n=1 Tax=Brooklawnia propionicigenes TaxID=3041175 RepID=A0AAN0K6I2_9ACTN|nr:hypothetical protein [Brooklawnia sp. SH051]BEH01847.1 hypothetical protein brsh051_11280 [Brooklawnia sp. SH051]
MRTRTTLQEPEDFTSGEGLRALLNRLHEAGPGAWQHDPVAADLMVYAAQKYDLLARKHGLDPWEAASAAFDVMRTKAARTADDPWGVVTHAVRITCIAEERGQGLLCSVHQARRPNFSVFHDAERLSDRENPLTDYHASFQVTDPDPTDTDTGADADAGVGPPAVRMSAHAAMDDAIALFVALEWPPHVARAGVEHICQALARAGNRQSAYELLRRDKHARALLDVNRTAWSALLRALLGHPNPAYAATASGRGILLRLLIGESREALLRDDDLVLMISLAAPKPGGR